MTRTVRIAALLIAAVPLVLGSTGCATTVSQWIVRTRDHQGDVAVAHKNFLDASNAYQLALKLNPRDAHARTGLTSVQLRLAESLFASSRFDDALDALALAGKYSPNDARVTEMRAEIEQAEIKRDIVVSNFPTYTVTGRAITRSYMQLKTQSDEIAKHLRRFGYTYDTDDLTAAIRQSYALSEDVTRVTNRLQQYRQLVESGVPEKGAAALAPPASLLPLP